MVGDWGGIRLGGQYDSYVLCVFCEYGSNYMQSMGVGGDGGTWVIRLVSLG